MRFENDVPNDDGIVFDEDLFVDVVVCDVGGLFIVDGNDVERGGDVVDGVIIPGDVFFMGIVKLVG